MVWVAAILMALVVGGTGTRPATREATTRPAVVSLEESDRMLARREREAREAHERAVRGALEERVRQLREIMDRATAGKRLDEANSAKERMGAADAGLKGLAKGMRKPVVLTLSGRIDGKSVVVIGQRSAVWQQVQYGPPAEVEVNGVKWDVSKSPSLENGGKTAYLPLRADWRTASLVKKSGRGLVEVVAGADGVRITFDDTEPGAGNYELTIELMPAMISGRDDGRDSK